MTGDVKDLVERLREEMGSIGGPSYAQMMQQRLEAATALEAQAEEIERLRDLFRSDGADHSRVVRDLTERHATRITKYADAVAALKAENERLLLIIRGANNIIADELDVLVQSHTINGDMRLDLPDDSAAALAIGKMSAWLSEVFLLTHSGPADANPTQDAELIDEPDPDLLRDDAHERRRMMKEYPDEE